MFNRKCHPTSMGLTVMVSAELSQSSSGSLPPSSSSLDPSWCVAWILYTPITTITTRAAIQTTITTVAAGGAAPGEEERRYHIVSYRVVSCTIKISDCLCPSIGWDKYLYDKHFFICVWLINKLDANNNSSLYNPCLIFIVLTNILFIYVKISLLRLMSLL